MLLTSGGPDACLNPPLPHFTVSDPLKSPSNPPPSPDCGAIYVACGDRYRDEALRSVRSLKHTNPNLTTRLLTDRAPVDPTAWDEVDVDPSLAGQKNRAKLFMDRAPWAKCLFVDTDTYIVGDLAEGFALLDRFDFAGHQSGGGHHYQLPGLPPSFSEVNSGVLFWRRCPQTAALFERWREYYDFYNQSEEVRTWDQKSLRMALWESDVRMAFLPSNFNLMPYAPAVIERDLIVAHGRNFENLERLRSRLAVSSNQRAYVPGLGAMRHPQAMSWGEILWTISRMLAWKLRNPLGRRKASQPVPRARAKD